MINNYTHADFTPAKYNWEIGNVRAVIRVFFHIVLLQCNDIYAHIE